MDADIDLVPRPTWQAELPEPQLVRWQPLRIGIVDLFYYDSEEFWFTNGHLVLRGNNGTGKSKVLSLTMPLLLDAEVKTSRVEPDGDPTKRMAWNLLVGTYDRRMGYAWIEFGRVGEDGVPRYLMLGAGLSTTAAKQKVDSWFFLVEGQGDCDRVNRDFWLTETDKGVLTERKLRERIQNRIGRVFDTADSYRRAVDERLFSLGRYRYGALMDTLIQLRRPHLSEKPDEGKLSNALSESLPPIDPNLLTDVAAALGGLEDDRVELDVYERLLAVVIQFEKRYRTYAATQSRRQARLLRQAQTEFDTTSREFNAAQDEQRRALRLEEQLTESEREAELALTAAQAALELLLQDPAMQDAASLEKMRLAALARDRDVQNAEDSVSRQRVFLKTEEERSRTSSQQLEKVLMTINERQREVAAAAEPAGLLSVYESTVLHEATTESLTGLEPKAVEGANNQLRRAITARKEAIGTVRRRLEDVAVLEATQRLKQELFDDANDALTEALEEQIRADERFEDLGLEHMESWDDYVGTLRELCLQAEDVVGALEGWVRSLDGDHPAFSLLRRAHAELLQVYAEQRSKLRANVEEAQEQQQKLRAEWIELKSGVDPEPPAPHTRSPNARAGRVGAPLWKLIDFKDSVLPEQRVGLEAALEGAGLLDAWVNADGTAEATGEALDTTLRPRATELRPLSDWLVACCPEESPVSPRAVHALLQGIACGGEDALESEAWLGTDGRFRLGGLSGRWQKTAAAYVGFTARAEARAARLAAIEAEQVALAAKLEGLALQLTALDGRKVRGEEEWACAPSDAALRNGLAQSKAKGEAVKQRKLKIQTQLAALDTARVACDAAKELLRKDAGDLNLPADKLALNQAEAAIDSVASAVLYLVAAVQSYLSGLSQYHIQLEREAGFRETWEIEAGKLADAREEAARANAEYGVKKAQVGLRVDELQKQLHDARERVNSCGQQLRTASGKASDAKIARAVADTDAGGKQLIMEARTRERGSAVTKLQRFAASGIFAAGVPDIVLPDQSTPWTIDPALTVARRAEQLLSNVDDKDTVWDRIQRTVGEDLSVLQTSLAALGYHCTGELTDFGQVVTVMYQNKPESPDRLAAILKKEIAQRKELLDMKEREVLENHLQAEIASAVQRLLQAASAYVVDVNNELDRRPTSTGVKFRLVWEPLNEGEGAPVGLAAARQKLLNTSSDLWTNEDRAIVGAMLSQRIAAERERAESGSGPDTGGNLADHLARALDYRRWHRFRVERWQGVWRKLSGPASSGEKALGLTVPLFAAIASFYGKGKGATAPRLMLLDEAFAGIDDAARAQLMGLIQEFDLDFIITSEREWGCYATLPGVSICQLQRKPGLDAVFVSRWVWDGRAKTQVTDPNRRFPTGVQ